MALTADDRSRFDDYNSRYKARFGFPFVICARKNKKEAILLAFPERLTHTREEEIAAALDQIFQIAALRLADLLP
jgi:2-oxo-4-hydroxy-4-carboxy--5-ureidoimidazoline (OHCU) decarboxylase